MNKNLKTTLGVTALIFLLVINVALITNLLKPDTPPQASSLPSYSPQEPSSLEPSVEPLPQHSPSTRPSASPSPSEPETPDPGITAQDSVPATRLISVISTSEALRATTGACATPGTLERTEDSGATWEPVEIDLVSYVRIRVPDPSTYFVIGASEDCAAAQYASFSSGAAWVNRDNQLPNSWYVDPVDRHTIHGLTAAVPAPCTVVTDLVGLDTSRGAILCGDGQLGWTTDGGATWTLETGLPGAAAVTGLGAEVMVAGYGAQADCDGISIHSAAQGAAPKLVNCVSVPDAANLNPADIAVGQRDGNVWLWAGDRIFRSTDQGSSWS